MFNFLELDTDNRKRILKYDAAALLEEVSNVNEKDYKKSSQRIAPPVQALKKAFGKTELSRVDFAKMKMYVNEHCIYPDDEIMKFYNALIDKKLSDNIDFYRQVIELVDDKEYLKLKDDKNDEIESFRSSYEELDMPFDYDTFIRFLCVPSNDSVERMKAEEQNQIIGKLNEIIKEREEDYNKLAKSYNEQIKQIRTLNNDIGRLTNEKEKYEKILSIDNVTAKLGSLLPNDFEPTTYEEVYSKLNDLEHEQYEKGNYEKCRLIIAAKYSLIKIIDQKE